MELSCIYHQERQRSLAVNLVENIKAHPVADAALARFHADVLHQICFEKYNRFAIFVIKDDNMCYYKPDSYLFVRTMEFNCIRNQKHNGVKL